MADTALNARLARLLKRLEPEVRRAFAEAIRQAGAAVDREALIAALERGDRGAVIEMLRLNQQALFPLSEAVRTTYLAAGQSVGEVLPLRIRAGFGFGGNPRAVEAVQRIVGGMVQNIDAEGTQSLLRVISEGVNEGIPAERLSQRLIGRKVGSKRVGGFLGLDSELTDDVIRARAILSDPERIRSYFVKDRETGRWKPRFKLSDRTYDSKVIAAIKEGRAIRGAELDKIIEAHKSKALGHRGRKIARTETLNALRAGNHDGFGQLVERGYRVTVTWKAALIRSRDSHIALHGQQVEYGELFQSPVTGALMEHPGDTSHGAPGSEIISCRCAAIYRIKR